ncbi:MAG: excinuclease ABC subunit UvrC [Gammaproteobacteria bacterium]|nr:MAG: excinuclease ABC subunit UvrC [Gammaproteobacteria bacterium]
MVELNKNLKFDPKQFIKTLPQDPGVYRMLDENEKFLYVGKAKNLKKRVSTYFSKTQASARIAKMLTQTCDMEIAVTNTEAEALLLENNLIKEHRPRYNILLRDDKSYPYIYISSKHKFPQITFYRGRPKKTGRYFGPYASVSAARYALNLLQKVFKVRQCDDYFFNHRSRPCLQYQIERCSAPCVGYIEETSYKNDIDAASEFLDGNSDQLIEQFVQKMDAASVDLDYEKAAGYRDKIGMLREVSEQQYVSSEDGNVDIVAVSNEGDVACVQVFNIRSGMNLGNKSYFPKLPEAEMPEKVLAAFLGQYYLTHIIPEEIITSHQPDDVDVLKLMLGNKLGEKIDIIHAPRSKRARWLEIANKNVVAALKSKLATKAGLAQRFEALQEELHLEYMPTRMECFDVSHTQGEATVASCVVFEQEGAVKSDYRRFNIEGIEPGDDYAAMHQALTRRYTRLKKGEGKLPDILFIDGGKGQVSKAVEALQELQVEGVKIIGVAKGVERRAGEETLIPADGSPEIHLSAHSLALHLIQQIRDEAHRFAITSHRKRRNKKRMHSPLENIEGLGPKRRQNLLKYFGGIRGVSKAGEEELAKVPGISKNLAKAIYQEMHSTGS